MTRNQLLDRLQDRLLIGDGAMGTLLHERGAPWDGSFENLNRTNPDMVRGVHEDYAAVGCEMIETNTFQANRVSLAQRKLEGHIEDINRAGVKLARNAAGSNILVAGSMGPITPKVVENELTTEDIADVYTEQATILADAGVDLLLLETFTDLNMLLTALMAARTTCDLPIICQMAFSEFGRTKGDEAIVALGQLEAHGADVVGGNCGSGPTGILPYIQRMAESSLIPLSALPNTSYPQYVDGRYVFISSADYVAERAVELADAGANIIGGCCGTTPEHLRLIVDRLKGRQSATRHLIKREPPALDVYEPVETRPRGFLDEMDDHTLILVELDPPKGMDYTRVLDSARALKLAQVDAITSADNSLATVRMSTFTMSHIIQREVGLPVIVHCACRDRNLIGQQSELMGASALGLRYILALTGDPASMANIGASSVYDTNSIGLIKLIDELNKGRNLAGTSIQRGTGFVIGCALDAGGAKIDGQLRRLQRKVEAGAQYVMTQPLYDHARIREMYQRVEAEFDVPVFVGIMPMISRRNAEFLHNEVPGIRVPDDMLERMRSADPERAAEVGIEISSELIETALEAGAPGIYLIPPFGRHELALKLIPIIKQWDRTHRPARVEA